MMMNKNKTQHVKQNTRLPDLENIYNLATQTNRPLDNKIPASLT